LTQNKAELSEILIITLVFEKDANFFAENCPKIAENYDHNIDRWSPCPELTLSVSALFFVASLCTRQILLNMAP
jgi:hypothetical protein